jgi:transcriptional antiterminator NusG
MVKKWYVLHTQTGYEDKVKASIETRAETGNLKHLVSQVLVPTEKVSEVKEGKKKISTRKFFPGYVLVEMELTDETWYLIKDTPGVSGFIGSGRRPVPLQEEEVAAILKQTEIAKEKPTPKVIFEKGEGVRVLEGPFANFNGAIEEVNPTKGKLKVTISIFGRATPVELEYWQVEKI